MYNREFYINTWDYDSKTGKSTPKKKAVKGEFVTKQISQNYGLQFFYHKTGNRFTISEYRTGVAVVIGKSLKEAIKIANSVFPKHPELFNKIREEIESGQEYFNFHSTGNKTVYKIPFVN